MIRSFISILLFLSWVSVSYAASDSLIVPFQRQRFHDRIKEEQKLCDKMDGKLDQLVKVSSDNEINLQVTDAIFRRVDNIRAYIETEKKIVTNNDKIGQLRYVETMLQNYRINCATQKLNSLSAPSLVVTFENILKANVDSQSILPFIKETTYQIGTALVEIFPNNKGYSESKQLLFFKFGNLYPDKILANIAPYSNSVYADSLIVIAAKNNPKQLYDYASASKTTVGKLIRQSHSLTVKTIVELSETENALRYYPFLDDLLYGRKTIGQLYPYVADGENGYDSIAYFKLLVSTEVDYHERLVKGDTPVAMFGVNGLRDMLYKKSLQQFITPINELHDEPNLTIRMKAIAPLSAEELYYVMVMGENDIYTSSYKHCFNRLLELMGANPQMDQLLVNVRFDCFKKFIKMAANFNRLDTVLKLMPATNATLLMRAFVANLEKGDNLEDAVDVADSYSSIQNPLLQKEMLKNVKDNEQRCINTGDERGVVIYNILKTIFQSFNDKNIDLTTELGIASIYTLKYEDLSDEEGKVVEQVFFYGDDDGKNFFPAFKNSFSSNDWRITTSKEWIEIKSLKGKNVVIYANLPLDSDVNLDDSAQIHLNEFLKKEHMSPTVVVHRGHSYWLPRTIARMGKDAKLVLLGSCGGFKNLTQIISNCPDAHIISTKEIGKGDINKPVINYINQSLLAGKTLVWKDMWTSLSALFKTESNKGLAESWEDYIPPYKNLGAIFIKACNNKLGD